MEISKITNNTSSSTSHKVPASNTQKSQTKTPIFNTTSKSKSNEISYTKASTNNQQVTNNNTRSKYIEETKNPDYKVKNGDNIANIAKKFGVEERRLLAYNGLTKETGSKLKIGQILKIPPTRKIKNVKTLNDVAPALGVSSNFVKKLKIAEDGNIGDNKFHNTPYIDKAGVRTIGIGHALKSGDSESLTDQQVCELLAKDLLKAEENLIAVLGENVYNRLPQSMKEALLDMCFNKGTAIIENTEGLLYCIKNEKYEAAINKFTNIKNSKGQEMSGLAKRRLFDISIAIKMYNGKIPQSNINTAQNIYNRGIQLLRAECTKKNLNFDAQLNGYNADVKSYFGNMIKLVTK